MCLFHLNMFLVFFFLIMVAVEAGSAFRCVLSALYIFPGLLSEFRENNIFHIQNSHSSKKVQVYASHSTHPFCKVNENSRPGVWCWQVFIFLLPVVIFWCFDFQYARWLVHTSAESLFLKKLTTLSISSSLKYPLFV